MLRVFDFIRDLTVLSIILRLVTAFLCGGLIGLEREYKRRPAGFRTHILICLGAAMTTLTSQYLFLEMHMYTDVARLGAQVIAGIGFIGAGTIIVTKQKRVKGLTTAAGMWTAAIIGLCCGAGYVECALFAALLVIFAELVLIRLEKGARKASDSVNLYVEYRMSEDINAIVRCVSQLGLTLADFQVTRVSDEEGQKFCSVLSLHSAQNRKVENVAARLLDVSGVLCVEEI